MSIANGLSSGVCGHFLRRRLFQSPTGRYKPGCSCLEWAKERSWQGSWALICRLLLKILFLPVHFTSPFSLVVSSLVWTSLEGWSPGWKVWEWGHKFSFYRLSDNLFLLTFTHSYFSRCLCLHFLSHTGVKLAYSGQYYLCRHWDLTSLCSAKSFIIPPSDFLLA